MNLSPISYKDLRWMELAQDRV